MTSENQPDSPRLLDDFPAPDLQEWRQEVERLLRGAPFAKKMFTKTLEGITISPMYTAEDTRDLPWSEHLPGQAPFLRGSWATGISNPTWLVVQDIPYPTVEEFNNALRHDMKRGQTGVMLKLDEAGQRGLDPDQAPEGDVGRNGTSLASLSELCTALDGVDLEKVPFAIEPGSSALPVAALLVALLNKQGKSPEAMRACLGSDPIYGIAERGALPVSADQLFDELAILTRWARGNAPRVVTLPINEIPWHEGGADSALSLGLVLASGVETLRKMEERGLSPEKVAPHMLFRLVVGTDFFMEIAKLRAMRLLWSDVLAASGCSGAEVRPKVHARTSRRVLTRRDPHVNMLRATTMAMSAVLGGAESLHVSPFDEVDSLPDEFSRRIARNVQLMLAEECHFDHVVDPAGGSWYVEKLTAELAEKAWSVFQEIEAAGGVIEALKSGLVQKKVAAAAQARQERLALGKDVLVGTNRYANPQEPERQPRLPDYAALRAKRAAAMAKQRTAGAHEDHLIVLKRLESIISAEDDELLDYLVEAGAQGATLGELTGILRHDADTELQVEPIPLRRDAQAFEDLRDKVEAVRAVEAGRSRVFCVCLGDFARYMPRVDFVRRFFQAGGFEVVADRFFTDSGAAAAAAGESGAAQVILVGLDSTYEELAVEVTQKLMALSSKPRIMLAGKPGDLEAELEAAGVRDFIHIRSNLLEVLSSLINTKEVGE
jgi:methylmalonyl-CoA mutase